MSSGRTYRIESTETVVEEIIAATGFYAEVGEGDIYTTFNGEQFFFATKVTRRHFVAEVTEVSTGNGETKTEQTQPKLIEGKVNEVTGKNTETEENRRLWSGLSMLYSSLVNHRMWLGAVSLFLILAVAGVITLFIVGAQESIQHGNELRDTNAAVAAVEEQVKTLTDQQASSLTVVKGVDSNWLILRNQQGMIIDQVKLPEETVNYQGCIDALQAVITDYPLGDRLAATQTICGSNNG